LVPSKSQAARIAVRRRRSVTVVVAVVMLAACGRLRVPRLGTATENRYGTFPVGRDSRRDLGPVREPELVQDVLHVAFHGALTDVGGGGDLAVAEPLGHEHGHLPLAPGERTGSVAGQRRCQVLGLPMQRAHAECVRQRGRRGSSRSWTPSRSS
jgi:hypothetical protein